MTKSEKLLRELIALPSINPAFLPAQHPQAGERRVAEYLAGVAVSAGLDVRFQPICPGRSNFLARLEPSGKVRQRILLAPHLDTVPATAEQLTPRKQDGKLYGRGACDTKGSVAAMFAAISELARQGRRPKETEIVFAGLADEEQAQAGSRALVAEGFKADLAIVGEPTRLQIITAHKGTIWLRVTTEGKAAHGARPELGRNAVHLMSRVVDVLETEYAVQLRARSHPLLGHPTVNVGKISGGTQPNIVPDSCEILLDRRTLPGETLAGVEREMNALFRRHKLKAAIEDTKLASCLPLETNPRLPWVKQFLAAMGQTRPAGVRFFCDASVLAHAGIPSVVFGPGDIAQAHTREEYISLDSLERAEAMLKRFLLSLP
jgi:acetylornithine deacetylase/succinyl-diaminopimelate desuccinylase-like protein